MRHKKRYQNTFRISACFYGDNLSEMEKEEAKKAVKGIVDIFDAKTGRIDFVTDALSVGELT